MACRICERPQRLPVGQGRVYVSVPVPELATKWLDVLGPRGERWTSVDGTLEAAVDDFPAWLRGLRAASWSDVEVCSISLLFLPPETPLTFATFQNTRTLGEWFALLDAEFLTRVLDEKALTTHFHPIWDLSTRSHFGWECLSRGVAPDGSLIPPAKLFGTAREAGLSFPLDRLARQTALRNAQHARLPGKLFINFVPTAIYDPVFCLRTTVSLAHELGLDPAQIVFEVVESEQVDDEAHLKRIVDYYRQQGFLIALDDVGSGYSSLNLVAALRPDILKVDAAIVRDLDRDETHQSVFRALAGIAADTGALLLAEGVETKAEFDVAQALGATLGQGYLWGRPTASPELPPRWA